MCWYIYVIKCDKEKYYVGKTKNVKNRFEEHCNGINCPIWTKIYKPIKLINYFKSKSEFDEDNTTKKYMIQYGIENVRGGSYCSLTLKYEEITIINREISTLQNTCYICKSHIHFMSDCPHKISPKNTEIIGKKCFDDTEIENNLIIPSKKKKMDEDNKKYNKIKIIKKLEVFFKLTNIPTHINDFKKFRIDELIKKNKVIKIIISHLKKYIDNNDQEIQKYQKKLYFNDIELDHNNISLVVLKIILFYKIIKKI